MTTRMATQTVIWAMGLVATWVCGGLSAAWADRPSAPKLLPNTTLAYVRVADSRELVERFNQTAFGRMFEDQEIKPLVTELYGIASQAFVQVQEQIGVSLGELLSVPQGEFCLALVGRVQGPPGVVFLLEVGDQAPIARKLLEVAVQAAVNAGVNKRVEQIGDQEVTILEGRGAYLEREGVIVGSSDPTLLQEIMRVWDGDSEVKTLAENREFTSIMERSVGTKDERPQISWFIDPIELFTNLSRDNVGGQMALAMLPALGLDGIKCAGGSMILATEEFDSIQYIHVLLDNPRGGILDMVAIESGDLTPEDWVPLDAAAYMTVYWDAQHTLSAFRKLYDTMRGEGALSGDIRRRMSDRLQIDVEKDILEQLGDRFTLVNWFEKPAKINSGANLLGIRLRDAAAMGQTVDGLAVRFGERLTKKSTRGITYYAITPGRRNRPELDTDLVRRPTPCVAIVGDYLLLSDSLKCLEAAIDTKNDPARSISNELEYKLIASKAKQYLRSDKPGMFVFSRPEETMRSFYELAMSPTTRRRLDEAAQRNPFFQSLNQALRDHPLPPFSTIAKYLAPGGGTLVSDQSGIHYMTFALKRE